MLIIDNRECKLIELIKNKTSFTIPYELKSLQLGDIIISSIIHPEKSLIIERKCMTDMIASIKDGRYKEQKIRLQAEESNNSNTKICYLIEGNVQELRFPADKTILYGSLVSSIFRDKIPLIRTTNLYETLDIIIRIHERMSKDISDFFPISNIIKNETLELNDNNSNINQNSNINRNINRNINNNDNTYLDKIKKCKKENLTPELWNQIAFSSIPGVSTNIAKKITEIFPTIKILIEAYKNSDNDSSRIKLISEIILTDNGKVKRRIGNVVAQRIMEYLYSGNADNTGNTDNTDNTGNTGNTGNADNTLIIN